MGEYSEAFVAFDVPKKKHAVAIADSDRIGEVRFVGEVENSPAAIRSRGWKRYDRLHVCYETGSTGYGHAGRCAIPVTTARWLSRP